MVELATLPDVAVPGASFVGGEASALSHVADTVLRALDLASYDVVLVSDPVTACRLSASAHHASRLWLLSSAFPTVEDLLVGRLPAELAAAAAAARWVICPDETVRGALDRWVPDVARRTAVYPTGETDVGLRKLLERSFPIAPAVRALASEGLKVVIAGHDLGFITGIVEYLRLLTGVEVRVDHVPVFANHDQARSRELIAWADVAVCEWCSPVAIWYSRNKRASQRLIVRLHRMELYTDWPSQVAINNVDQVVCVSPHYAQLTREATGWPRAKVVCIPNYVDCDLFDRPKLVSARYHLGFIGVVPMRKRLDLALDIVERLRRRDARYRLFVKTKMFWEYPWNWNKPEERAHAADLMRRIQSSALLGEGVVFDDFGADVAAWLRKIGFVLSTSDDESFHLAPAEGMASGAVPVVRNWPGVHTIYDSRWIHPDVDTMADAVAELVEFGRWDEASAFAKRQVRASIDIGQVCERFAEVLIKNLPASTAEGTLAVALP